MSASPELDHILPFPDKDPSWREKASCRGLDTNFFFLERSDARVNNSYAEVRVMCVACPVRKDCLNYAVDNNIPQGMYGGFAPKDRRLIARGELAPSITMWQMIKDLRSIGHGQPFEEASKILGLSVDEVRLRYRNDEYAEPVVA